MANGYDLYLRSLSLTNPMAAFAQGAEIARQTQEIGLKATTAAVGAVMDAVRSQQAQQRIDAEIADSKDRLAFQREEAGKRDALAQQRLALQRLAIERRNQPSGAPPQLLQPGVTFEPFPGAESQDVGGQQPTIPEAQAESIGIGANLDFSAGSPAESSLLPPLDNAGDSPAAPSPSPTASQPQPQAAPKPGVITRAFSNGGILRTITTDDGRRLEQWGTQNPKTGAISWHAPTTIKGEQPGKTALLPGMTDSGDGTYDWMGGKFRVAGAYADQSPRFERVDGGPSPLTYETLDDAMAARDKLKEQGIAMRLTPGSDGRVHASISDAPTKTAANPITAGMSATDLRNFHAAVSELQNPPDVEKVAAAGKAPTNPSTGKPWPPTPPDPKADQAGYEAWRKAWFYGDSGGLAKGIQMSDADWRIGHAKAQQAIAQRIADSLNLREVGKSNRRHYTADDVMRLLGPDEVQGQSAPAPAPPEAIARPSQPAAPVQPYQPKTSIVRGLIGDK